MLKGGKTVRLPPGEVGRIAAKLVDRFPRCANGVTPPPDYHVPCDVTVINKRNITVCAVPKHATHWSIMRDNVVGGSYSPRAKQIVVNVNPMMCVPPATWKEDIRGVLRHEFTHAADPYVHIRKTKYAKYSATNQNECAYYNDPVEVAAQLAEVEQELLTSKVRHRVIRDVAKGYTLPGQESEVLRESRTYMNRTHCMTPKIQRRFLQLAARLWQEGKFGRRP